MEPSAVQFREISPKYYALVGNALSVAVAALTFGVAFLRTGQWIFNLLGALLAILSIFPHEFLHALCFREDVYFYTYFKGGMAFVVGDEDFEKWRFILMSMLPNVVFGFVPFIVFLLNPAYRLLGTMGAVAIALGVGDYINVYNALTQVPPKGKIFMYQMSTYWYQ